MTAAPYANEPAAAVCYDLGYNPDEALLTGYRPDLPEPEGFAAFWAETLAAARAHELIVHHEPMDAGLPLLDVADIRFRGYAGEPVRAWLLMPRGGRDLPCVVRYVGYGGGRGHPAQHTLWPVAGFAYLVMDNRGQGGETPDTADDGSPVCRGLADPRCYYYRRLITDACRAAEVAATHPRIDPARVAVLGGSQGGGLALAVAGLTSLPAAALVDLPFLTDWRRALRVADRGPYAHLVAHAAARGLDSARVLATLSHFDGMSFAARATAPALFSVALRDRVCPPSTAYAAYNHYGGPKAIEVYEFNDHEGGGDGHTLKQLAYLRELW